MRAKRFYAGRKLAVVIGHEVGTGFDLYGRALARHMGRFIPGNPSSFRRTWWASPASRPPTGFTMWRRRTARSSRIFAHTALFEPLLGKGTGRFDASKFTWIGNMDAVVGVCGVWDHAGISQFDDLFTKETVVGAGGAGTGGPLTQFPTAVQAAAWRQDQADPGLQRLGGDQARDGARRIAGRLRHPDVDLKTEWRDDFNSGRFKIILQLGRERSPELVGFPHVYDYTKT